MQPAQRRAILAILGMVESGIQQLRMLLEDESPLPSSSPPQNEQPGAPVEHVNHHISYLSEQEDNDLERLMEEERLAMEQEHARAVKQFWSDSEGK